MKIVALDFETANASNASACSLGMTIYEDGEIVDNFEWYFKPAKRYNYFTNSHIHHIYKKDVQDKPEFNYYYEDLKKILEDAIIVAHNTSFDIKVLNAICDVYGFDHFKNKVIDTVTMARIVYPELYNHKLNTIAKYLNVDLSHHNAKSDSYACMMIVLKAMEAFNEYDLDNLLKKLGMNYHQNK